MKLWPFGKRAQELSIELRRALYRTFGVESVESDKMRFVAQRGKLGGGPVDRVCIFDPGLLTAPELARCNYSNVMTGNKGLLFTGHILKGPQFSESNSIVLYDQRA